MMLALWQLNSDRTTRHPKMTLLAVLERAFDEIKNDEGCDHMERIYQVRDLLFDMEGAQAEVCRRIKRVDKQLMDATREKAPDVPVIERQLAMLKDQLKDLVNAEIRMEIYFSNLCRS